MKYDYFTFVGARFLTDAITNATRTGCDIKIIPFAIGQHHGFTIWILRKANDGPLFAKCLS